MACLKVRPTYATPYYGDDQVERLDSAPTDVIFRTEKEAQRRSAAITHC